MRHSCDTATVANGTRGKGRGDGEEKEVVKGRVPPPPTNNGAITHLTVRNALHAGNRMRNVMAVQPVTAIIFLSVHRLSRPRGHCVRSLLLDVQRSRPAVTSCPFISRARRAAACGRESCNSRDGVIRCAFPAGSPARSPQVRVNT